MAISKLSLQMLKFSRNAVCVDIHDPDATDLSFVDLPGTRWCHRAIHSCY
jgi:hypothetical protein